jgi:3-hydroxyisobutyrate dehydrogenase
MTAARFPRVAFLGLGAMGYPMAGRVAARFDTLVWNRTEAVARRHAEEFGTRPGSLGDLHDVDVVVSCLASAPVVAAVADAARASLRPGSVWVDCTSGEPEASRALARDLAAAGIEFLDAPVSGMAHGARAGTLTVLVGGPVESVDRARPVLEAMAGRIVHTGAVGTGVLAKAANNALFAGAFWMVAEVVAAAGEAGLDADRLLESVNASSGRSALTEDFLPRFVLPDPAASSYRLGQSARDVAALLAATGAPPGGAPGALSDLLRRYQELVDRLGPQADAAQAFDAIATGR